MQRPLKTAIVTGSNTGIGFETALGLARSEHVGHVILACRSESKALAAVSAIEQALGEEEDATQKTIIEYMHLDLSSLSQVKVFVDTFEARALPLHILVNNAGGNYPNERTEDGLEFCFGVNHLAHFYLTQLLTPLLLQCTPASVVNVSSVMHRFGSLDFEKAARTYTSWSYSTSKLANLLTAFAFNRRYAKRGVTCTAVSPGSVDSDIWRTWTVYPAAFRILRSMIFLSPAEGAQPSIRAALEPFEALSPPFEPTAERYYTPYLTPSCCPVPFVFWGKFVKSFPATPTAQARDHVNQDLLWRYSTKLIDEIVTRPRL